MIYKRGNHWHMDVVVSGVRYREALDTTDKREAATLEKKRVSEIHQGKGASQAGREFARKPFNAAADQFLEDRKPHVSERTHQLERERLKPLRAFFAEKPLLRVKAEDVAAFQRHRREQVAGRTVNMEVGVLRQMMKRGKRWNVVGEDVILDRENTRSIAQVLTPEQKRTLFETAAANPDWMVTHCAAVLAVSTTCRGVELKNLHWRDVDLFERVLTVRRSKTEAGCRTIPLNGDGVAALSRLWERAQLNEATAPEHFVFPTCEHGINDPTKPQKSFRTAWRKIAKAAGLPGFRFHDLRHQAVTELAEGGASDATMMAVAGHMSRRMLEHYSHVRMARKREALDKLSSGLMGPGAQAEKPVSEAVN
jgi:integrase